MRRRLAVLLLVTAAIGGMSGTALAGHVLSGVKSYTGCLVSGEGVIVKVKEGDSPASRCTSAQLEVHLSGGDITGVLTPAGSGLQGGGSNGSLSLSLATGFKLPQGCDNDDIPKWDGTSWTCAQDVNNTYTAGTGLDLTGSEFSVDAGYQLPSSATTGDSVIRTSSGTWTTEQFTRAGESCAAGQFVRATSSAGGVTCATPPASSNAWVQSSGTAGQILDDGDFHVFAELNPGAGTYFIIAKATIGSQQNVDQFRNVRCVLVVDGVTYDEAFLGDVVLNDETRLPVALTTVASVTTGFSLQCRAGEGADGIGIGEIKLIGVKL